MYNHVVTPMWNSVCEGEGLRTAWLHWQPRGLGWGWGPGAGAWGGGGDLGVSARQQYLLCFPLSTPPSHSRCGKCGSQELSTWWGTLCSPPSTLSPSEARPILEQRGWPQSGGCSSVPSSPVPVVSYTRRGPMAPLDSQDPHRPARPASVGSLHTACP